MTVTMLHHKFDVCLAGMDAGEAAVLRILWHLEDAVKRTRRKHSTFYFGSEAANDRLKAVCLPYLSFEGSKQIASAWTCLQDPVS